MSKALITGGSSGIGLEFSRELAAKGYDLILVARGGNGLEPTVENLRQEFGVNVETIAGDLADHTDVEKVMAKIRQTEDLEYLINCAGFVLHVNLLSTDPEDFKTQRAAMDVMATNILLFCAEAAEVMKKRGGGKIINIASASAWWFQGNYSAIKHWVVAYTEALAIALKGTGVTATVVAPAWMKTNFHTSAGLERPAVPDWLYVNVEQAARAGLKTAEKSKVLCVPSLKWKIIVWFLAHGPRTWARSMTRRYMASRNYSKHGSVQQ